MGGWPTNGPYLIRIHDTRPSGAEIMLDIG